MRYRAGDRYIAMRYSRLHILMTSYLVLSYYLTTGMTPDKVEFGIVVWD